MARVLISTLKEKPLDFSLVDFIWENVINAGWSKRRGVASQNTIRGYLETLLTIVEDDEPVLAIERADPFTILLFDKFQAASFKDILQEFKSKKTVKIVIVE